LALNTHPCIIASPSNGFVYVFPFYLIILILELYFNVILTLLKILNIFGKVEGNEEIVVKKLLYNKKLLLENVMISEDVI